jgi:Mechanosensitive ion channel, conserved TM helix
MTELPGWFSDLEQAWRDILGSIVAYLPNLIGAIVLLLLGWLLARWTRAGILKFGNVANRLFRNTFAGTGLVRFQLTERILEVIGIAVYWLIILVFLTAAARAAELEAFSIWLNQMLSVVPAIIGCAIIIAVGYLVGQFVRDIVAATFASSGVRQSAILSRLAHATVILIAVVIGIDQLGIDVLFLVTIIAILLASIVGGAALAFGLGSRDFVANVVAAHNVQKLYKPGQSIRLGDISGEILDLTPTSVVLATEEGRASVPAKEFHNSASILITPEETVG